MKRRYAFTLVELLVVIAIISLLVAILLPVAQRFRRSAIVLNCPVAYLAENSTVHLTGSGGHTLQITKWYGKWSLSSACQPAWSPSGRLLGVPLTGNAFSTTDTASYTLIFEPLTWQAHYYVPVGKAGFVGWADSDRFIECGRADRDSPWVYYLRDAETGNVVQTIQPDNGPFAFDFLAPVPPATGAAYIASASHQISSKTRTSAIVLVRKDLAIRKIICDDGSTMTNYHPRVDPMGEWVAWTRQEGGGYHVAIKSLKETSSAQPLMLPDPPDVLGGCLQFCDWTKDGQLLVNMLKAFNSETYHEDWRLIVINRDGKVMREIPIAPSPMRYGRASWRKYGHR